MICETCKAEGKTSSVRNTGMSKTLMACLPFYDEQGRHHFHDANVTNAEYRCTNGHVWNTHGMGSCWCGWPNEQKAAPAEPAAPTNSEANFATISVNAAGLLTCAPTGPSNAILVDRDDLEALYALVGADVRTTTLKDVVAKLTSFLERGTP